jgi:hypothetical protein
MGRNSGFKAPLGFTFFKTFASKNGKTNNVPGGIRWPKQSKINAHTRNAPAQLPRAQNIAVRLARTLLRAAA